MTNYEWLLQMGGEERQAWFDAEHVDANDVSTRKGDVRADGVCANDANVDSREQLEAWAHEEIAEKWAQSDREVTMIMDDLLDMLDRQAAIAHREAFMRGRASLDDEFAEYADEIVELAAQMDELQKRLEAQINETACQSADYVAEQRLAIELQAQVDELQAERDNLARDLAECDENRIEFRDQRDHAEEMLAQMERERDYWKLHPERWADKCKDAESERDAYHERVCELEIELAQANGNLKNTTHNHAAAKAKYERAVRDAERAEMRQREAERKYAELLEKPPEDAWAERIGMLEAENAELREKLGEAIGHAHEIGKLGDLEARAG